MNWNDAPEVKWGLNPKSPVDFPFESEEQRKTAAQNALGIMESERGTHPDPAALEREIRRTSAIAGTEAQAVVAPAAAPKKMSWDSAPEVAATAPQETWNQAPEAKASWWDTIKSIPGSTLGQIQQWVGGTLQSLAEEPPSPPFGSGVSPQEYENEDSSHIKYIAKKQGKTPAQVVEDIRKDREQSPLAKKGAEIYKAGEETEQAATPANMDWWQRAVQQGASSVLSQIPALGATLIARSPAPAIGAAAHMQFGQSYGEKREAGMEPGTAAGSSAIDAAAEGLFELLPMNFLTHHAGGPVLSTIVGTMLREVPTEVATTAVQSANAMLSHKPDMTWQEYGQSLLDTVGATMVSAPLLGGAAKVMSPLSRMAKPETPAPAPTLQAWQDNPIAVMSQSTDLGLVNGELTGPNIDEPTVTMDSAQESQMRQSLNAIDPETLTQKDLDEATKVLENFKKSQRAPALPGAEQAWSQVATAPTSPVEDIGELGASSRQAANAVNYINPNQGERLDRTILYGPEGYEGLTPRQVAPKPGTYTLGVPSEDRPADYLRALHDTVEQWRNQYLPNDTIVLSNEQLFSNSALGWHYSTDTHSHMIVPAVLRKPSRGLGQYNPNTQASAFYNATHEFGHALITSQFYDGMTAATQVRDESRQGLVTSLEGVPAPQAAVIQEFNQLKEQVLSGKMTAEQFVQRWMGPAKVGRANFLKDLRVAPEAPAMQIVRAMERRAVATSNIANEVSQRALRKRMREDFLSIDEYLAEQVARHAYQQKWDQKSPLGQFFSGALNGLRSFFVKTKKDGIIAPGVAFQEWLDGISKTGRVVDEVATTVANKRAAGKKTPTTKKGSTPKAPLKTKVTRTAHNVQSDTFDREQRKALKQVSYLEQTGTIDSSAANDMRDLVKKAAWDDFVEVFQKHAVKSVKFEWDGEGNVNNDFKDWKDGKFDSPSFKAWFGDWVDDPEGSSVVRAGVFIQNNDGTLGVDRGRDSPPLVLFASAERLRQGENVFPASTLRGVQYAEANHPVPLQDGSVVPVVLNIRNPYIVQDFVSPAPDRATLQAQGFDGILYQNDLEGHTSFVVFSHDQVKVVPDRNPYARNSGIMLELDHDQGTPAGWGASKLWNGVRNFVNEPGPIRRSLRYIQGWSRHVLQMQQLAHVNPDLTDLTYMVNANTEYARYGASRRVDADRILNEWKSIGKENWRKIDKFLTAEKQGGVNWFELTRGEKQREGETVPWWSFQLSTTAKERLKQHGIDADTEYGSALARHVLNIKNNLLDYVNEDEQVLQEVLGHRYGHSQAVLNAAVKRLKFEIHQIRQKPFFPEGRFGNFMLTISQKRESGPGYEVVYREAFESRGKWEAAWRRAASKAGPDQQVRKHEVTDAQYVLMSLPKDFLDLAASELGLNETQVDTLAELLQPVKQEKLLNQFDLKKFGFKNTDAMRSYANFTWHHSNAEAKLLYRRKFNTAITSMRQRLRTAELDTKPESFNEVGRLTRVVRAMETMRDYVMSPPNEMQNMRALVSVGYLAYNVKTALVNLYGLATVWSDLSTKFGGLKGEVRFVRASYYASSSMRLTNLNDRKKGNYLPPDVQRALDRAIEEGVLSQSYAYHLAGMANQNALSRLPFYEYSGQITQKVVDLGMYPFRLVELATRRISFIAAFEEQLEKHPGEFNTAYETAVAQVNKLQNDYTLGNRVPFMRGGALKMGPVVPLATIFASFAQHMAFHGFGGYELGERRAARETLKEAVTEGKMTAEEAAKHNPKWYTWGYGYTARIWLLTMMLAGYEGLPGMENLIDLLEALWRHIGKKPLRQELREMIQAVDQDPVQWSRGLGANVAGFDVSRSLGFGRIFPGTDIAARSSDQDPEKAVGAATLDMLGPLGGFLKFGLESLSAMGGQKTWKDAAKKMPGGIGNLVNAYVWSQEGVKGPNGGQITLERTPEGRLAPRDLTAAEIAGKALGFNPEIVSRNREIMFATYDRKMYWQSKRVELLKSYVRAREEGDREAIADTKQAITDFNLDVPTEEWSKHFKVTGKDIGDAWKRYRKGQKAEEAGMPKEKRYRGLAEDIRRSYEKPESEPSDK